MPGALVSVEVVIGTLLLVGVLALVLTFTRRRYIARGVPLTLCGLRWSQQASWKMGLIRLGDNALEWYTLGGLSPRPKHRWTRQTLMLSAPSPLVGGELIAVLPDASRVPSSDGAAQFELALQASAYTALKSWQEAAPPGYDVNVA